MSVDRQSLGLPPRVTFVAPGTTFERLLKGALLNMFKLNNQILMGMVLFSLSETSLGELNATITKKLKLNDASKLVLTQVRGDMRIILEDGEGVPCFSFVWNVSWISWII